MNDLCSVTSDLNDYLNQQDALEELGKEITRRASDLVSPTGEMYPFKHDNFWTAIHTGEWSDNFNDKTVLTDPVAVGTEILRCVEMYWENYATKYAETRIHNEQNDY